MSTSMQAAGTELVPASAAESQPSSLVYGAWVEKLICIHLSRSLPKCASCNGQYDENDNNSANVMEEIEKSMGFIFQRKKNLEEEKENLQKAATAVLDVLNSGSI